MSEERGPLGRSVEDLVARIAAAAEPVLIEVYAIAGRRAAEMVVEEFERRFAETFRSELFKE